MSQNFFQPKPKGFPTDGSTDEGLGGLEIWADRRTDGRSNVWVGFRNNMGREFPSTAKRNVMNLGSGCSEGTSGVWGKYHPLLQYFFRRGGKEPPR